ncbi:MAG: hypothetical protein ACYYK0_01090 [Candidatus Eutrophobiaceae bacterium]
MSQCTIVPLGMASASGWQAYGDELHVRLPRGSDDGEALPAARHMVPLTIDAFDKVVLPV